MKDFLPAFFRVFRLFHFIGATSGTWVTVPTGACFCSLFLFGALGRAFDFFCLLCGRLFIGNITWCCWLLLAGLPWLSLYLLLDGCLLLDGRFLIPCVSYTGHSVVLVPSAWASFGPGRCLLFSLSVLGWVWRWQALCVRAVVGSSWQDKRQQ